MIVSDSVFYVKAPSQTFALFGQLFVVLRSLYSNFQIYFCLTYLIDSSGSESNLESDFDERSSEPKKKKQTKSKKQASSNKRSCQKITSKSVKRTKVVSNGSKREVKTRAYKDTSKLVIIPPNNSRFNEIVP